jgi:hypothetical protein
VYIAVQLTHFYSQTNKAGVFTYSVADIGTVTLQSMTTPSEFEAMRASLDKDLAERPLTPLQKVQYQHLKDLVDSGEEGWVEIVVVPSGGVLSPPRPGENYMTGVAIQQVGKCHHVDGYQTLTILYPLSTACIWNGLSRQ